MLFTGLDVSNCVSGVKEGKSFWLLLDQLLKFISLYKDLVVYRHRPETEVMAREPLSQDYFVHHC